MANLGNMFQSAKKEKNAQTHPRRTIQWIHYSKLFRSAYQKYSEEQEEVQALADVIRVDGEILQPILARKTDVDEYEIIAGHKRTLACKLLAEEQNLKQYEFLPCILETVSDVRARFQVMTSNHHHEKTPYEIMTEIEDMKYLLETYPEEFPDVSGRGRMVEKLAKQLKLSRSVVSDYQSMAHNLSAESKEALKSGIITKSAAVALASLPEELQQELLEEGITTHNEIKEYKETLKPERLEEEQDVPDPICLEDEEPPELEEKLKESKALENEVPIVNSGNKYEDEPEYTEEADEETEVGTVGAFSTDTEAQEEAEEASKSADTVSPEEMLRQIIHEEARDLGDLKVTAIVTRILSSLPELKKVKKERIWNT